MTPLTPEEVIALLDKKPYAPYLAPIVDKARKGQITPLCRVDTEGCDYEVFAYEVPGRAGILRPHAIGFLEGKTSPVFHEQYRNDVHRDHVVARFIRERAEKLEAKLIRSEARKQFTHKLTPGAILVGSWGYEQTNVDFYEVVEVPSPKSVRVLKIASQAVPGGSDVVPVVGRYLEVDPHLHRVTVDNTVKIKDYIVLVVWDGKPCYQTPANMGH